MFLEEVRVGVGQNLAVLAKAYGHKVDAVRDIWNNPGRTGERGSRLSWVQTVYRHNQPIGPNPRAYCVDACTPDDNLPFYFTNDEIKDEPNPRRHFWDEPNRLAPSAALGTTRWRAITSIAVITGK